MRGALGSSLQPLCQQGGDESAQWNSFFCSGEMNHLACLAQEAGLEGGGVEGTLRSTGPQVPELPGIPVVGHCSTSRGLHAVQGKHRGWLSGLPLLSQKRGA